MDSCSSKALRVPHFILSKKPLTAALITCLLFLLATKTLASISISDNASKIDTFTVQYLYDKSNKLAIDDIVDTTFSNEIANQFSMGYREGTAWFKIDIQNRSDNDHFVLYFTEPFWTTFDLYEFKNGLWVIHKNGLNAELNDREIKDANPAFLIQPPKQQVTTYYIKGTTVSSHIGKFILFTEKEFYQPGRINITDAFNIYSGILFFTMLLTSLLYFSMREPIYLYYTGYVTAFIIWISAQSGTYLYLGLPGWIDALHAVGTVFVGFLVLFSGCLLRLKQFAPVTAKLFKASAAIIFACGIAITLQIPYTNLFFNIFSSLFFTLLLITSIKAWINNYFTGARYYLIALIIYMPTMALMTLTYNGLIVNTDITRYAFTVGSFIEILFFSFILANRFMAVKNEKLHAQNELINEKDSHAKFLEDEVAKRTNDLNQINKQLLQQTQELEIAKQQLTVEASTDALSTLYNRRYFLREATSIFNEALETKQIISLLMLDIDRFKGINDNYGHDIGDKAIVACAGVLKSIANENDIIARYGGEEFVILSLQNTLDDVLSQAESIRSKVEKSCIKISDEKTICLTLSIGVTQIDFELDRNIEDMLKRADKALYLAKNKGRNNVISL